ncbi:hypothetical protein [Streptomyces sp. PSAA01]|uniref:hypothetical protein n=1 Tax=Streptomyces sp. PSAA01 TaxID=2912762 RepID=UPI001F284320|nr:hypothetical protein [Streptomyces sp. PSAA01]MCG0284238.1 hypothetical protein [Streptomyces sp. PSAA01]
MAHPREDPPSLPIELRPYLEELLRRIRTVCGPHLVSDFAVGSLALRDYRHGRSDVDVMVAVEPSLPGPALHDLPGALAHPHLPCPAAGLELVVYGTDFLSRPSAAAGYLLDLNTGPLAEPRRLRRGAVPGILVRHRPLRRPSDRALAVRAPRPGGDRRAGAPGRAGRDPRLRP